MKRNDCAILYSAKIVKTKIYKLKFESDETNLNL